MELFQARYFVAVAEELSFRRAAERLHVSSSSLSVQIRKLEAEIGADLLIRESHHISLTAAGHVFLKEMRQALAQAKRGVAMARQAASGELGLAIGYGTVAELGVFPRIIPAFKEQWPDAQLTLRNLNTPQQVVALNRNELDVAFVCPPISTEELDMQELTREPFVVVLPAHHPLVDAPVISFELLAGEPLVMYSRTLDPDSFRQIEQHFSAAHAGMNITYELESPLAMIGLIAAGEGCGILPQYARSLCTDDVAVCKPLGPPSIVRTLAIAKRRECGVLAESFYRFAAEYVAAETLSSAKVA